MIYRTLLLILLCSWALVTHAALDDLGDGLIYDSAQNLIWLQDANLPRTETFGIPGIDAEGGMDWDTANAWIAAMNAARYKGYQDWRLWRVVQPDPSCSAQFDPGDPWPIQGRGVGCEGNELARLLRQLPLPASGPFVNFNGDAYWSGNAYAPDPQDFAWALRGEDMVQSQRRTSFSYFAWPVRNANVSPPQPIPAWNLWGLLALILLLVLMAYSSLVSRRQRLDD